MRPAHTLSTLSAALTLLMGSLASASASQPRGLTDLPDPSVEAEQKAFVVPEGYEINLWAAEPLLRKPVQMNWDSQGRLWVVCSTTYPQIKPGEDAIDQVVILEDTDNDGKADCGSPADFVSWAKGGFVPEPISGWQWMLMRLGFAALVLWTLWDWHPYRLSSQEYPVGLAHVADLTWLHEIKGPLTWVPRVGLYEEFFIAACLLMVPYVMGVALRWVLPLLAAMHILVWTYHNSQGYTYHGMQMISLILVGQAAVVWWKRKGSAAELRAQLWYYSRGIIIAGYVTSVLTKIVNSKGMWLWNSQYLSVEIIKTHRLSFYKDLEPEFAGDPQSAVFLLDHPYIAQVLFGIGFIIELLAWVGLRDRKWSCITGIAIIAMHLSITWLMRLSFTNHQILCLIFLVNVPWLIALAVSRSRQPRLSPQTLP